MSWKGEKFRHMEAARRIKTISKYPHYRTQPYHCSVCYTEGSTIRKYIVIYKYKNGHDWEQTFPCETSAEEFVESQKPFLEWYKISKIDLGEL